MQLIVHTFGGEVSPSTEREFGRAEITQEGNDPLFEGVELQLITVNIIKKDMIKFFIICP